MPKMSFDDIQRLAIENGIVLLDYRDLDMLRSDFPSLRTQDAPKLLSVLSTCLGNWDECVDRDASRMVIREAAMEAEISLFND